MIFVNGQSMSPEEAVNSVDINSAISEIIEKVVSSDIPIEGSVRDSNIVVDSVCELYSKFNVEDDGGAFFETARDRVMQGVQSYIFEHADIPQSLLETLEFEREIDIHADKPVKFAESTNDVGTPWMLSSENGIDRSVVADVIVHPDKYQDLLNRVADLKSEGKGIEANVLLYNELFELSNEVRIERGEEALEPFTEDRINFGSHGVKGYDSTPIEKKPKHEDTADDKTDSVDKENENQDKIDKQDSIVDHLTGDFKIVANCILDLKEAKTITDVVGAFGRVIVGMAKRDLGSLRTIFDVIDYTSGKTDNDGIVKKYDDFFHGIEAKLSPHRVGLDDKDKDADTDKPDTDKEKDTDKYSEIDGNSEIEKQNTENKPDTENPEFDDRPNTDIPEADKKEDIEKSEVDNKPDVEQPEADNKRDIEKLENDDTQDTEKPEFDDNQDIDKPEPELKENIENSESDNKQDTENPEADNKPEIERQDTDSKSDTDKPEFDNKPDTEKNENDNKQDTEKSENDNKQDTEKPDTEDKSDTDKKETDNNQDTEKSELDNTNDTEKANETDAQTEVEKAENETKPEVEAEKVDETTSDEKSDTNKETSTTDLTDLEENKLDSNLDRTDVDEDEDDVAALEDEDTDSDKVDASDTDNPYEDNDGSKDNDDTESHLSNEDNKEDNEQDNQYSTDISESGDVDSGDSSMLDQISDILPSDVNTIIDLIKDLMGAESALDVGKAFGDAVIDLVESRLGNLESQLEMLANPIDSAFDTNIADKISEVFQAIDDFFGGGEFADFLSGCQEAIDTTIGESTEAMSQFQEVVDTAFNNFEVPEPVDFRAVDEVGQVPDSFSTDVSAENTINEINVEMEEFVSQKIPEINDVDTGDEFQYDDIGFDDTKDIEQTYTDTAIDETDANNNLDDMISQNQFNNEAVQPDQEFDFDDNIDIDSDAENNIDMTDPASGTEQMGEALEADESIIEEIIEILL